MDFGLCEIAFIPIRQGLSDKSEMLSQVVFGETFEILINRGDWIRIKLYSDAYEGWITKDSVSLINESEFINLQMNNTVFCDDLQTVLIKNGVEKITVPMGALFNNVSIESGEFTLNGSLYKLENANHKIDDNSSKRQLIVSTCKKMMNAPYLWGGKTPWGIDCSGFVQLAYKIAGISLPRDSSQQVEIGNTINFINETQAGDILFFDDDEGNIVHVGVVYNSGTIIHASKKVRTDIIDHQGIYNRELKRYTHNLRVIKSII